MSESTLYREAEPWTAGAVATWVVPVGPDYEAMAEVMLQKIDVAAWWTRDNRQLLAEQLWRAGIGDTDEQ